MSVLMWQWDKRVASIKPYGTFVQDVMSRGVDEYDQDNGIWLQPSTFNYLQALSLWHWKKRAEK